MNKYIYTGTEEQLIECGYKVFYKIGFAINKTIYIDFDTNEIIFDAYDRNGENIEPYIQDLLAKGLVKVVGE